MREELYRTLLERWTVVCDWRVGMLIPRFRRPVMRDMAKIELRFCPAFPRLFLLTCVPSLYLYSPLMCSGIQYLSITRRQNSSRTPLVTDNICCEDPSLIPPRLFNGGLWAMTNTEYAYYTSSISMRVDFPYM